MSSLIRVQVKKERNYAVLDLTALEDRGLSWEAKGVHAYLVSRPPDWQIFFAELIKRSDKSGRDKTRRILNELKKSGYLKIIPLKNEATGQMEGWQYIVYEKPHRITEKPSDGETHLSVNQQGNNNHLFNNNHKQLPVSKNEQNCVFYKKSAYPMTREEFTTHIEKNENRSDLKIIVELARKKEPTYETAGQWHSFMTRNLKPAQELSIYTQEQRKRAYEMMRRKYRGKWGLETLLKFLDDANGQEHVVA